MEYIKERRKKHKREKYKRLYWKTSLLSEINDIKNNEENNINTIINQVQECYFKLEYNEEFLLYRIKEIQKNDFISNNMSSSLIALILGLIVGASNIIHEVINISKSKLKLMENILLIIGSLFFILIVAYLIVFFINEIASFQYNDKKIKQNYLNEKEIEIIKSIIESRGMILEK